MDKQEYAKCIEDDIDFLKRNLPKPLFECLWTGHIIDVLKASINMFYDQPSLPSNLDEAAELSANDAMIKRQFPSVVYNTGLKCFDHADLIKQFKAGAEWMAGQGETVEGYIAGINEVAAILAIPRKQHNKGDKVVVRIRKK